MAVRSFSYIRLLLLLALSGASCSGPGPGAPSAAASGSAASQTGAPSPSADDRPADGASPGAPAADAGQPRLTLTGPQSPRNCFRAGTDIGAGPMRWVLTVDDAGASPLRFVALAHQDDTPGCEPTARNPRPRIHVGGTIDYAPRSAGQTTFTFDPTMYACGRVQLDVSIFDATGRETLVLGTMVDYGVSCDPPLLCAPAFGSALLNVPYAFTATGGNGRYAWSTVPAAGVSPSRGDGSTFLQTYTVDGVYLTTVTSGQQSATCQVVTQAF